MRALTLSNSRCHTVAAVLDLDPNWLPTSSPPVSASTITRIAGVCQATVYSRDNIESVAPISTPSTSPCLIPVFPLVMSPVTCFCAPPRFPCCSQAVIFQPGAVPSAWTTLPSMPTWFFPQCSAWMTPSEPGPHPARPSFPRTLF